jgi:filamentous hemagglutinin
VIGGVGGTLVKGATSLVAKDGASEISGAVAGSYIGEKSGKIAENYLDKKDEKNDKK